MALERLPSAGRSVALCLFSSALASSLLLAMPAVAEEPTLVRVLVPPCNAGAFDVEAFAKDVALELKTDGAQVVEVVPAPPAAAPSGPEGPKATIRLEASPCSDKANELVLVLSDDLTHKTVERHLKVDDVPREMRARVLALAVAELLRASWAELSIPEPEREVLPPMAIPESVRVALRTPPRVAPPPSRWLRLDVGVLGRFYLTYGSALVGPVVTASFGSAERIPLRLRLDAKALFGTSYDPLGSISVHLVSGGAALVLAHSVGPIDVEVGPHVDLGWGEGTGSATSSTTVTSSASAVVTDVSALFDVRVALGGLFAASAAAEVGTVLTGLDAQADGRRAAGFGGPMAAVLLGVGRAF